MSQSPRSLRFYFDLISHNAWLAWARMPALCAEFDLQLQPIPVLFAGLLNHHGQVGPAEVAPKREWMLRNVLRKAHAHGIALAPPASHPFNPLVPLRALSALHGEQRVQATDRLFRATWAESKPIHDPACVAAELAACGLDAGAVMASIQTPAVKDALRQQTEQALAEGVFGVPTMAVDGELFFGFDDLPWLERKLAGTDPLPDPLPDLAAWQAIRPTAERRR